MEVAIILLSIAIILITSVLFDVIFERLIILKKIRKKRFIILFTVWLIISIIFIFFGKNVLLSYIIIIAYMCIFTLYVAKYFKNKKFDNMIGDWFACIGIYNFFSIILLVIGKVDNTDYTVFIIEISLIYVCYAFYFMLNSYKLILPKRLKIQMKKIIGIFVSLYILFVLIVNRDYMWIKYLVVIMILVSITIFTQLKKLNMFIKSALCVIVCLIFIFIMLCVASINYKSEVISTDVERIHVNRSKQELLTYSVGDRFIFYNEEKIKGKKRLIVYEIVNENGEEIIKECENVVDYKCIEILPQDGEWHLDKVTENIKITDNNLSKNKESKSNYVSYNLYCN